MDVFFFVIIYTAAISKTNKQTNNKTDIVLLEFDTFFDTKKKTGMKKKNITQSATATNNRNSQSVRERKKTTYNKDYNRPDMTHTTHTI